MRTDDGRTPDNGHSISSPCEPNSSGELKIARLYQDGPELDSRLTFKQMVIRAVTGQRSSPDLCFVTTSVKIYDP